jgi:hypothetical protein
MVSIKVETAEACCAHLTHTHQNPDSKDELVTTTVRDYDLAQTSQAIKGLFTGAAFMAFLHLYMGYVPPVSRPISQERTATLVVR